MTTRKKLGIGGAFALVALVAASIGWATTDPPTIHACYDKSTGALRLTNPDTNVPKGCTTKEAAVNWNQVGPQGVQGPAGPQGETGPQGPQGPPDTAAQTFVAKFGDPETTGKASTGRGADCTLAEVLLTAAGRVTAGGMPAAGQLLSISLNTALFSLLGNRYGGDGQTTFALPDLRSVAPSGMTYSICVEGVFPSISTQ
ncbi:MAG: tail fiber protein [Gaiellaceae bacterium]|jgi:hypothetical protein